MSNAEAPIEKDRVRVIADAVGEAINKLADSGENYTMPELGAALGYVMFKQGYDEAINNPLIRLFGSMAEAKEQKNG